MKRDNARQGLAIGAGLVIVALTAAAFWLSYSHLAGVASAYGLQASPVRAWAWPACLDLFIVAGELLMLRAALTKSVDPWAIGLTVVGSGGSIALNVAGVGTSAPLLAYVVAAVPPTAALLAFGALMRQVHEALSEPAEVGKNVPRSFAESANLERVLAPEVQPAAYPQLPAAVPEAVPAGARLLPIVARPAPVVPVAVLAAESPRTRREVRAEYVPEDELIARTREDFAGRIPTYRELKEKYGIGQPRASRIRAVLEDGLPS
ncbi:MAG: putative rane protein [Streptosporangiaceae bacterium]|nr:putative rane protein [Streptosporangiaceae bacterium]